jgi:hypothetical protein
MSKFALVTAGLLAISGLALTGCEREPATTETIPPPTVERTDDPAMDRDPVPAGERVDPAPGDPGTTPGTEPGMGTGTGTGTQQDQVGPPQGTETDTGTTGGY